LSIKTCIRAVKSGMAKRRNFKKKKIKEKVKHWDELAMTR